MQHKRRIFCLDPTLICIEVFSFLYLLNISVMLIENGPGQLTVRKNVYEESGENSPPLFFEAKGTNNDLCNKNLTISYISVVQPCRHSPHVATSSLNVATGTFSRS
jgi:hypothetical protein